MSPRTRAGPDHVSASRTPTSWTASATSLLRASCPFLRASSQASAQSVVSVRSSSAMDRAYRKAMREPRREVQGRRGTRAPDDGRQHARGPPPARSGRRAAAPGTPAPSGSASARRATRGRAPSSTMSSTTTTGAASCTPSTNTRPSICRDRDRDARLHLPEADRASPRRRRRAPAAAAWWPLIAKNIISARLP